MTTTCAELLLSGVLAVSGPSLAKDLDEGTIYRNNGSQIFIVADHLSILNNPCYNQKVMETTWTQKRNFKKILFKF